MYNRGLRVRRWVWGGRVVRGGGARVAPWGGALLHDVVQRPRLLRRNAAYPQTYQGIVTVAVKLMLSYGSVILTVLSRTAQ